MPIFKPWDVVKVPFPHADRPVRQRRPALVVVADELQTHHSLLWVLMITSADHRRWPGDVMIGDPGTAGLPAASVVRTAKIAVIDARDAALLGTLVGTDRKAIGTQMFGHLSAILAAAREASGSVHAQ